MRGRGDDLGRKIGIARRHSRAAALTNTMVCHQLQRAAAGQAAIEQPVTPCIHLPVHRGCLICGIQVQTATKMTVCCVSFLFTQVKGTTAGQINTGELQQMLVFHGRAAPAGIVTSLGVRLVRKSRSRGVLVHFDIDNLAICHFKRSLPQHMLHGHHNLGILHYQVGMENIITILHHDRRIG